MLIKLWLCLLRVITGKCGAKPDYHVPLSNFFVSNYQRKKNSDHVVVVGYSIENGVDYALVRNSWGKDWGEDGFFKLERNQCEKDLHREVWNCNGGFIPSEERPKLCNP